MKASASFVALAALFSASLVTATATNMLAACQAPYNGGKKVGSDCAYIHGVSSGDKVLKGKCWAGSAGGAGLYCAESKLYG